MSAFTPNHLAGHTGRYHLPPAVEQEFADVIWCKLSPQRRAQQAYFSKSSPLHLLGQSCEILDEPHLSDCLIVERMGLRLSYKPDERWDSHDNLQKLFYESISTEKRHRFELRRPLNGGTILDENEQAERDTVLEEAIDGAGIMQSLEPVIELLQRQRAHEDFAARRLLGQGGLQRQLLFKTSEAQGRTRRNARRWG